MCLCTSMYVCMYVWSYVYMYVWIYAPGYNKGTYSQSLEMSSLYREDSLYRELTPLWKKEAQKDEENNGNVYL